MDPNLVIPTKPSWQSVEVVGYTLLSHLDWNCANAGVQYTSSARIGCSVFTVNYYFLLVKDLSHV